MTEVRGCQIPEELHYWIESRIGFTSIEVDGTMETTS